MNPSFSRSRWVAVRGSRLCGLQGVVWLGCVALGCVVQALILASPTGCGREDGGDAVSDAAESKASGQPDAAGRGTSADAEAPEGTRHEARGTDASPEGTDRASDATTFPGGALHPGHEIPAAVIDAAVAQVLPALVAFRHALHEEPELSNREFKTSARVEARLRAQGLKPTRMAHTGVVARLSLLHAERGKDAVSGGPASGGPASDGPAKPPSVKREAGHAAGRRARVPLLALRADMDALPIEEKSGLPFRSRVTTQWQGQETAVSHACGHDIHTAVLMGVVESLRALQQQGVQLPPGELMFMFQPAEEGAPPGEEGGAALMLKEGVFAPRKPDAALALHTYHSLEVGEAGILAGHAWAAVDNFDVTITGEGGHGARPHLGVDALVVAAQAVSSFQTIVTRMIDPLQPVVISIGTIAGGVRRNVIADEVKMTGTVRSYDKQVQARVEQRMEAMLAGLTEAAGARYALRYEKREPTVYNHPALTRQVRASLERALGAGKVKTMERSTGGEDFARFAEQVPAVMFRLGVSDPKHPSGPLHSASFRADDGAIEKGVHTMLRVVLDWFAAQAS